MNTFLDSLICGLALYSIKYSLTYTWYIIMYNTGQNRERQPVGGNPSPYQSTVVQIQVPKTTHTNCRTVEHGPSNIIIINAIINYS